MSWSPFTIPSDTGSIQSCALFWASSNSKDTVNWLAVRGAKKLYFQLGILINILNVPI